MLLRKLCKLPVVLPLIFFPVILLPPALAAIWLQRAGQRSVTKLVPQLLHASLSAVVKEIRLQLAPAPEVTTLRAQAYQLGVGATCTVDWGNRARKDVLRNETLQPLDTFFTQLLSVSRAFPSFRYIYTDWFDADSGNWLECGWGQAGAGVPERFWWTEAENSSSASLHYFPADGSRLTLDTTGEPSPTPPELINSASWISYVAEGNTGWTPIDIWYDDIPTGEPLATLSSTVRDPRTNKVTMLFNVDLSMLFIEKELLKGRAPNSEIFVFDLRTNHFIGSTLGVPIHAPQDVQPYDVANTPYPTVTSLVRFLHAQYGSLSSVPSAEDVAIRLPNPSDTATQVEYILSLEPFNNSGTEWLFCQIIPRSIWLSPIQSTFGKAIGAAIGFAVAVAVVVCGLSLLESRELMRLQRSIESIANMELDDIAVPAGRSMLNEMQGVHRSLTAMVHALQELKSYLPQPLIDRRVLAVMEAHESGQLREETPTEFTEGTESTRRCSSVVALRPPRGIPPGGCPGLHVLRATVVYCNIIGTYASAAHEPSSPVTREPLVAEKLFALLEKSSLTIASACRANHGITLFFAGDRFALIFVGADTEVRAVTAALEIVGQEGEPTRGRLVRVPIRVGVGNSLVWLGKAGSSCWMSYTCVGAAMNISAALEAFNKRTGTSLLVDAPTYQRVQYSHRCLPVALVTYSGLEVFDRNRPEPIACPIFRNKSEGETEWMYEISSGSLSMSMSSRDPEACLRSAFDLYKRERYAEAQKILSSYPSEDPDSMSVHAKIISRLRESLALSRYCEQL
eukprot:TRINITY_DN12790_c0_g1_i1.p1 TRINITY_DN12790_c0_g1~~TRINITY_DN12790_c0_g1_i1.p1  ORF type:complete len:812 (+),score=74.53 TRINITY_DN12790_c0_g1_i1:54-2438(+)